MDFDFISIWPGARRAGKCVAGATDGTVARRSLDSCRQASGKEAEDVEQASGESQATFPASRRWRRDHPRSDCNVP